MTIVEHLLGWLDCTYHDDGPATLDMEPSIHCWTGSHKIFGTLAFVLLVIYVLSATSFGIFFLETPAAEVDVRWRENYVVLERNLKTFILVGTIFFSSYETIGIIGNFICFVVLAYLLLKKPEKEHVCTYGKEPCQDYRRPCSVDFFNYIKGQALITLDNPNSPVYQS